MLFSNGFAIASNVLTGLICGAITLLLFAQLRTDPKAQSLTVLTFILTAIGFVVVVIRLMALFAQPLHLLFLAATLLTGCLPLSVFQFVNDYLGTWTKPRRTLANIMAVFLIAIVALFVAQEFTGQVILLDLDSVFIAANGEIMYSYGPWVGVSAVVILFDEICLWLTLGLAIAYFRRQKSGFDRRVIVGIVILTAGIIIVPIPGIEHYAFEQLLYTSGSVLLIGPVLGQRLFDPLSQLNRRLERRAQQMTLITKVGNQAHTLVSLTELLPSVAKEICQSFGYAQVQIAVYDTKSALIAYGSSDAEGHILNSASADVEIAQLHSPSRVAPIAIDLPIPIGKALSDDIFTGTMTISVKQGEAITSDERGVLNILARQIALAIHNAQLFEQVQRANTAKTMFISFVSHELRNEVSNVISLTDGLLNAPEEYDNQRLQPIHEPDVRKINQTGLQLKRLLDDVVDWGQIESGQVTLVTQRVAPLPILQEVAAQARDRARKGVVVKTIYPSTLPAVQADPTRLQQILLNLIGNAIKFTTQGSITLDARVEDRFLRFAVADTGRGIAKAVQATLFEMYRQASPEIRRRFGGSGLGLTISKQFVERQGGHIWIESEEGKGTTFFFTVPLADVPSEAHETQ